VRLSSACGVLTTKTIAELDFDTDNKNNFNGPPLQTFPIATHHPNTLTFCSRSWRLMESGVNGGVVYFLKFNAIHARPEA